MKHDRVHATFKTAVGEVFATIQITASSAVAQASLVDAHLFGDWRITIRADRAGGNQISWQREGGEVLPPNEADLPAAHQETLRTAARAMFAWTVES